METSYDNIKRDNWICQGEKEVSKEGKEKNDEKCIDFKAWRENKMENKTIARIR